MANPRNYVKDADDTPPGVTPSNYETGKGANARLRKINLNVDIATQAELNEAFNLLSNAIAGATGDLTAYYTKSEADAISTALSTSLHNEIEAIDNSLSNYALSTTVADAYKVTVSDADEQPSSFVYTIMQGESEAGTINVPKDMFVEGASFQGTVLVLSVRGQDTPISTDLSGLVDVYTGGSTTDAVVSVDKDTNVITVTATEAIARVGTSEDASSANTIYGAKKYAEEKAAAVAVSAEGDTGDGALVTADDANNMITVGSTQKLKDAVTAAETALQTISNGKDSVYVTTTIGTKTNNEQTVGVAVTVAALTAGTNGLAEATDVKQYVDGKITDLSVSAAGDAYVNATSTGKAITVTATDKLTAVVNVVETTSAAWSAAETNAKTYTDTVSAALSTAVNTEIGAEKTRAEGVEQALSGAIDNLSSSLSAAQGDAYISAYVDGNTVKVEALCATVWNEVSAKADLTAVDGLSAIYKKIAKVNDAVSSTRFDLPITDDYEDIDDIIADVIEIRKALNMLRETAGGGGGGDELPTGYDFYGIVELPEVGTSERALYGVKVIDNNNVVTLLKSKATEATFADTDAAFEPEPTSGIVVITHNGYSTGYSLYGSSGDYYLERYTGDSEGQSYATFTEVTVSAAETFYNS